MQNDFASFAAGPIGGLRKALIENNLNSFHMLTLLHSTLHTPKTGRRQRCAHRALGREDRLAPAGAASFWRKTLKPAIRCGYTLVYNFRL
jgi:hypothetical protein